MAPPFVKRTRRAAPLPWAISIRGNMGCAVRQHTGAYCSWFSTRHERYDAVVGLDGKGSDVFRDVLVHTAMDMGLRTAFIKVLPWYALYPLTDAFTVWTFTPPPGAPPTTTPDTPPRPSPLPFPAFPPDAPPHTTTRWDHTHTHTTFPPPPTPLRTTIRCRHWHATTARISRAAACHHVAACAALVSVAATPCARLRARASTARVNCHGNRARYLPLRRAMLNSPALTFASCAAPTAHTCRQATWLPPYSTAAACRATACFTARSPYLRMDRTRTRVYGRFAFRDTRGIHGFAGC